MQSGKKIDKKSIDSAKLQVGSRTANTASLITFGRFVTLLITGAAFIIVARLLGPSVYGIYVLAISYIGLFTVIADLAVCTSVNKFIGQYLAENNKDELEKTISNGYASVILTR